MDEFFMRRALELAKKGGENVKPNPMVGAVIVKDGQIIGEGYHEIYGGPHAEVNAISSLKQSAQGGILYVTLEPCCHYGKTPPCVNTVMENALKRVVIGNVDPNPLVKGKSIEILKEHGIEVTVGVLEKECRDLNKEFNRSWE
ncbi:diaminohydroxyphosphoribosylaminopyrimidine deaminase [Clostridium acidisoli DSM 12555]|uniref:Riboflavin biosynthesis protein RibD n=1 Tax=Clostridium acidisoli DSM 12555 TaxID=1121291 RepID=A0A1W1XV43_9CLOT|nr:diaminohydroxyphosphoribosylaminopyrimidine deaminase [Clostridium acidisoli DSM 12555]